MKVNQNKNNHKLNKLCTKSFINSKKDKVLLDNSHNKSEINKNSKAITKYPFLKNSKSTNKNTKKCDLNEKYNSVRESIFNNSIINKDIIRIYNSSNKKSVIANKNKISRINKKSEKNKNYKIISNYNNNNEIKKYGNPHHIRHTLSVNNRNSNIVGYNKTINFIRIKNPQLNKVLNNYNEKNNTKEKKSNCFLPIRNYNSLHKNNNQMNRSLNYSMNKRNTNHENLEHKRRCNNSLKNKDNTINRSFDNTHLKVKLNKNRSLENSYLNFYKVDKKIMNGNILDKNKKLKKTIIQNYKYNLNLCDDILCNTDKVNPDINNDINIISSSFHYEREFEKEAKKDMKENKDKKQLDKGIEKLKIENKPKNERNNSQTERDLNKTMKSKMNTSNLPISSKSLKKRKKIKIEEKNKKNSFQNILKAKENNNIKKINNNINEKINNINNLINNSKNANKDNKKKDNIINIENYLSTLPNKNNMEVHSEIFDNDKNEKSDEIFEIIYDVKVKSFTEYEQDKKNIVNNTNNTNDTNTNEPIHRILIRSPKKESQNTFADIINNEEENENYSNGKEKFIEDRDEYNIALKETFSKDRFSFRPTNNDSRETFPDIRSQNNDKVLDKKDFINNETMPAYYGFDNMSKNDIPPMKKTKQNKTTIKKIKKF